MKYWIVGILITDDGISDHKEDDYFSGKEIEDCFNIGYESGLETKKIKAQELSKEEYEQLLSKCNKSSSS